MTNQQLCTWHPLGKFLLGPIGNDIGAMVYVATFGLSFVHFQTVFMGHADDIAGERALSRTYAQRGLDLDPLDPFVYFTMGRTFWLEADLESGLACLERVTSLSPNYAQGIYAGGWTETLSGRDLEGREHVDLENTTMR